MSTGPLDLELSEGHYEGVGRVLLHFRGWEVPAPRAALIVIHGLFEHSGRYTDLATAMARFGFSTYAPDLRGHGASDGARGHIRRFDVLLQDLDRFRREVQGLAPLGTPIFLIGHSLGALVALRYLEEYESPVGGAVLVSPWLATAVHLPRWKVVLATFLDRLAPGFPFHFRIDPASLSRDPARVAAYRDDPHIHRIITPRMFTETAAAMQMAAQRGDRISVPVHFLLAGEDRLLNTRRSLALARSLAADAVSVDLLEGWYHEVLQERDREEAFARIRDWLDARLGTG